jgi:hypothetical protein
MVTKRLEHLLRMLRAPGFNMKLQFNLADLQPGAVPGVKDLNDVGILIGDNL